MRFLSKFSHSSLSLVERMGQYQPGGPRVSVASRRSSSKWRSISRISWRSAKLSDIDPVLKTHGQSKGIFKLFHTFRKQATQKFLYYENPRCKAVCSSRLFARTFCVNPQKSTGKVNLWKDGTNKPQATIECPGAVWFHTCHLLVGNDMDNMLSTISIYLDSGSLQWIHPWVQITRASAFDSWVGCLRAVSPRASQIDLHNDTFENAQSISKRLNMSQRY